MGDLFRCTFEVANERDEEMSLQNKLYAWCEDAPNVREGKESFCVETDTIYWRGRTVVVKDDDGNGNTRYSWYIQSLNENTALVFLNMGTNLGEWLDQFYSDLDDSNRAAAFRTWPMLMEAIANGEDDNYSKMGLPALIRIKNPTDEEYSLWVIAFQIENIDYANLDTKYVLDKVSSSIKFTQAMLLEYLNNDLSFWDKLFSFGKAFVKGWNKGKMLKTAASIGVAVLSGGSISLDDA